MVAVLASLSPLAAQVFPLQLFSVDYHQLALSAYSILRVTAKRSPLMKAFSEAALIE
jgi:hypothetical protein